jgi:hypothetical protein
MTNIKLFEREKIAKEFPQLRQNFKSLLALNPNHFGNSGKSSLVASMLINQIPFTNAWDVLAFSLS